MMKRLSRRNTGAQSQESLEKSDIDIEFDILYDMSFDEEDMIVKNLGISFITSLFALIVIMLLLANANSTTETYKEKNIQSLRAKLKLSVQEKIQKQFQFTIADEFEGEFEKKQLIVAPILGLGNRLRTMKDFFVLEKCTKIKRMYDISMYWPKTEDLNADFSDLFSKPIIKQVDLQEILNSKSFVIVTQYSTSVTTDSIEKALRHDVKGKVRFVSNLKRLKFETLQALSKEFEAILILSGWGLSLRSVSESCAKTKEFQFYNSTSPSREVGKIIFPLLKELQELNREKRKLVGIHIRQSDLIKHLDYAKKTASAQQSLTILEQKLKFGDVVFISSDEMKGALVIASKLDKLGYKVLYITDENKYLLNGGPNRNTKSGMQFAVADMLLLAYCDVIWANSRKSSFAKIAVKMSGTKINYII